MYITVGAQPVHVVQVHVVQVHVVQILMGVEFEE